MSDARPRYTIEQLVALKDEFDIYQSRVRGVIQRWAHLAPGIDFDTMDDVDALVVLLAKKYKEGDENE